MKLEFHGDLTREEFLLEWFGYIGGRELGNPEQRFTNHPKDILEFVDKCKLENRPAFMSVATRVKHGVIYGIDRIYFDFDAKKPRQRENMELDVLKFVSKLKPIIPLIIKTFHGYHVYVFFKHGTIKITNGAKELYMTIQQLLINGEEYKSSCRPVLGRVMGLARIPTSWHEKGVWCIAVNEELKPTKVRGLDYYRNYGVDSSFIERAVRQAKITREVEKQKPTMYYGRPPNGQFHIRPCFLYVLEGREMGHQQRLAFVIEAFWAGKKFDEIIDLFRNRRDFDEGITIYQLDWQLRKIQQEMLKPYRCLTMMGLNWCVKSKCPIWKHKFSKSHHVV